MKINSIIVVSAPASLAVMHTLDYLRVCS